MKNEIHAASNPSPLLLVLLLLEIAALPAWSASDPQITSWLTSDSGKYARVYPTTADQLAGRSVATWGRGSGGQSLPAYNGVQEVDSSADWVYLRTTGLGIHVMGPWYFDAAKTQLFDNFPANTKTLYRLPRHPVSSAVKTLTGLGPIGIFVDGVAMYDGRDALHWDGSSEVPGPGGYWNRDAYVNEKPSFDPNNAHQDQSGTYHYHANPPALRYLLGDHVLLDARTKTYHENTADTSPHHSPILGWVSDGFPIYGPYGYSDATNANSRVRRMTSGFVLRDGTHGADNLAATGRATLPAWAVRFYHVSPNQSGPAVGQWYPLGRYMEDHAYLGDLGKTQGKDFDLDECNGRFCVTPEFPNGTYAYFVAIEPDGTPIFPYNIGRAFHGDPTGGSGQSVPETVVTNFIGGPAAAPSAPFVTSTNNTVTLVWSSVEGGTYRVESSPDSNSWTVRATNIVSQGIATKTQLAADGSDTYRAVRTALAQYDPVTGVNTNGMGRRGGRGGRGGRGDGGPRGGPGRMNGPGGEGGITGISPNFGAPGQSVVLTINLNANAQPPLPPQDVPIASVTIGGVSATNLRHVTPTQVRAVFAIPASASSGPQAVTIVFPGPPFDPQMSLSYTLNNAFTIH